VEIIDMRRQVGQILKDDQRFAGGFCFGRVTSAAHAGETYWIITTTLDMSPMVGE